MADCIYWHDYRFVKANKNTISLVRSERWAGLGLFIAAFNFSCWYYFKYLGLASVTDPKEEAPWQDLKIGY